MSIIVITNVFWKFVKIWKLKSVLWKFVIQMFVKILYWEIFENLYLKLLWNIYAIFVWMKVMQSERFYN